MTRPRAAAASERDAFTLAQLAKMHRARVADTAGTLKRRAQAARATGLDAVTVHLPVGDARLVADVLNEWARERETAADTDAVTARREGAPS